MTLPQRDGRIARTQNPSATKCAINVRPIFAPVEIGASIRLDFAFSTDDAPLLRGPLDPCNQLAVAVRGGMVFDGLPPAKRS